jgi:hypothetical protein
VKSIVGVLLVEGLDSRDELLYAQKELIDFFALRWKVPSGLSEVTKIIVGSWLGSISSRVCQE